MDAKVFIDKWFLQLAPHFQGDYTTKCLKKEMREDLEEILKSTKEREQRLVEVLKELCHLNSCEQEGIESAMPLPEDWYKTFLKAEYLIEELQNK